MIAAPPRPSTVNPHALDFRGWKRRRAHALRCEPLESGRRDPDGRPTFDPDGRARREAVAHLSRVLDAPDTPADVRASLVVVLADAEAA